MDYNKSKEKEKENAAQWRDQWAHRLPSSSALGL
jgi:hypothetical protein